jgi:hypothetical protein
MAASSEASWFETREDALLTMRVWDLIQRSIAKRRVSKDEAIEVDCASSSAFPEEPIGALRKNAPRIAAATVTPLRKLGGTAPHRRIRHAVPYVVVIGSVG